MRRLLFLFVALLVACGLTAEGQLPSSAITIDGGPSLVGDAGDIRLGAWPDSLSAWKHARTLRIDNRTLGKLTAYPLLVILDASRIGYASTSANGADLRFADATGADLAFEIERWDSSGKSYVWVNVPIVADHATTEIGMYYGNSAATDGQRPKDVWDGDYVAVFHLVDARDSTGGHTATNTGGTTIDGAAASALRFDGAAQSFDTGSSEHLDKWTIEAWVRAESDMETGAELSRGTNYQIGASSAGFTTPGGLVVTSNFVPVGTNQWHQIFARYDGSSLVAFVDEGRSSEQAYSGQCGEPGGTAKIGANFKGGVDEVRISRVARPIDYARATNRAVTDRYVAYGEERSR